MKLTLSYTIHVTNSTDTTCTLHSMELTVDFITMPIKEMEIWSKKLKRVIKIEKCTQHPHMYTVYTRASSAALTAVILYESCLRELQRGSGGRTVQQTSG